MKNAPNATRRLGRPLAGLAGAAAVVLATAAAWAGTGSTKATMDPDWKNAPSARYAALEGPACLNELRKRGVSFELVAEARGVVTPVRVIDGVGGVLYRTAQSREKRAASPHEVIDCRLVLALDDFSEILKRHGIDEVLMFSGWRPPPKSWPVDKPAVRHPGAMAIDLFRFGRWVDPNAPSTNGGDQPAGAAEASPSTPAPSKAPADEGPTSKPPADDAPTNKPPADNAPTSEAPAGETPPSEPPAGETAPAKVPSPSKRIREWLDVKEHFDGKVGNETCGADAPTAKLSPQARLLREIVCETGERRLFTSILTPNYNQPHHNHMHLDLAPGAHWRLVR